MFVYKYSQVQGCLSSDTEKKGEQASTGSPDFSRSWAPAASLNFMDLWVSALCFPTVIHLGNIITRKERACFAQNWAEVCDPPALPGIIPLPPPCWAPAVTFLKDGSFRTAQCSRRTHQEVTRVKSSYPHSSSFTPPDSQCHLLLPEPIFGFN